MGSLTTIGLLSIAIVHVLTVFYGASSMLSEAFLVVTLSPSAATRRQRRFLNTSITI